MSKPKIVEGTNVKHEVHGVGKVVQVSVRLGQCDVDFLRGPRRVVPCKELTPRKPAKKRKYTGQV